MSAFGVSLTLHAVVLIALAFIKYQVERASPEVALDSVFSEERVQEEFEQQVDTSTEVAETMNLVASAVASSGGGSGIGGGGGTGSGSASAKIDSSTSLKEPTFNIRAGAISLPGLNIIGDDLGAGQVTGETGRVVEGYGAALGQITQELIRLMRDEKVLACWMFDASESMEDDRREIRDNFHKVYEELGLVSKSEEKLRMAEEPILTSIFTFNTNANELTAKPTSDVKLIRAAIDKVVKDESGDENFCQSATTVISKYAKLAAGQKRKLVLILASDESGDDDSKLEESIEI
ncbi:MAG: VWA domain-containing protein, partial [Planctomycetaceae bacterium]|nr:VWA domain-containing protein [Planctomycetaceae bacterium]